MQGHHPIIMVRCTGYITNCQELSLLMVCRQCLHRPEARDLDLQARYWISWLATGHPQTKTTLEPLMCAQAEGSTISFSSGERATPMLYGSLTCSDLMCMTVQLISEWRQPTGGQHGGRVLVRPCWDAHIVQRRVLHQVLKVRLVVRVSILCLPCVPCTRCRP